MSDQKQLKMGVIGVSGRGILYKQWHQPQGRSGDRNRPFYHRQRRSSSREAQESQGLQREVRIPCFCTAAAAPIRRSNQEPPEKS